MKRFLSAVLITAMVIATVPFSAVAEGGTVISITKGPGYVSDANRNGVTVTPEISVVSGEAPAGYKYQWYAQDNWSTEYILPWETGQSITLNTQIPNGYYLNFEATPLDSDGNAIGDTVKSTHYISNSPYKGKNDKPSPTAEQSSAYASTPAEYIFEVDGVKFILLDRLYNGEYYVMMESSVGKKKFDTDNSQAIKFDPTVSTSLAYWLNNDFLSGGTLPNSVKDRIVEEYWATDYNTAYGVFNSKYKIGLLSYSEYLRYIGRFGFSLSDYTSGDGWEGWWLRSSYRSSANNNKIYVCSENGTLGNLLEYNPNSGSGYVRPTFHLSADFFENVSVASAGTKVAEILRENGIGIDTVISITPGPGYDSNVNHNSMTVTPEIKVISGITPAGYKYQWYQGDNGEYILPWETEASIKIHSQLKSGWLWFEATPLDSEGNAIGASVKSKYIHTFPMKGNNDFTGPTAEQSKAWHDTPPEYLFEVDGVKFILLDRLWNGEYYVMTENSVDKKAFDSRAGSGKQFDPTVSENIAYWLNNDFLASDYLPETVKNHITEENWTTEGDGDWGNSNKTYKVGLLSYSEYNRYLGRFGLWVPEYGEHPTDWQGFWLRTLKNNNKAYASAKNGGTDDGTGIMGTLYHYDEQKTANFVRPTFRLSANFFKTAKIDLDKAGERVRRILIDECTSEELGLLYTKEELSNLSWELESFEIYNTTIGKEKTVTAEAVIKNGINRDELPVLLFAVYQNGIFEGMQIMPKELASASDVITTYKLDFNNSQAGKTYKAFVWDSFLTLRPIAGSLDTNKTLSLVELSENPDLRNDLVKVYMEDSDYNNIPEAVDGKTSFDKPSPVLLKWNCINNRCNFTLNISENSDMSNPISYQTGNKTSCQVYNLKVGTRYYWNVSADFDNGERYTSNISSFETADNVPRMIYAPGLRNARDIGGWKIDASHRVKQGLIYRTYCFAQISNGKETVYLQSDGVQMLRNATGVKTEIDLRNEEHQAVSVLGNDINYLSYGMNYEGDYLSNNKNVIKQIFDTFADSSNYPIIYHCQAGADRTGAITYLLNGLLGVKKDDLMRDYLLTNFANTGNKRAYGTISEKYVKTLDNYQGDNLSEKIYNYLKNEIGVSATNLNQIRNNLIEQSN